MCETNDELYVNEHYKFGCKEREKAEFQDHVRRVQEAQDKLADKYSPNHPQRVFHTKTHACLTGKLNLLENRPESTRHGIFRSNGKESYKILARFSNGVGYVQRDLKPDVKGVALKIFGVTDRSTSADGQKPRTIDFLMTNSPNPFGRDQEEFVRFMEASVNPGILNINLVTFMLAHP